jgi:hypothetical protein
MQRAPRVGFSAFPTEALLDFSASEKWGMETGWNISQVFLSASGFLHLLFFAGNVFGAKRELNLFFATLQRRIDENFCFE